MIAVMEFIIDMYERHRVELGVPKKVNKFKKIRDDLVTELDSE